MRLEKLSDQEVGRLVRALATYHATGETQELKGRECGYYDFIKADIDEIEQRYTAKCDTNRSNRQRSSTTVNDRQQSSTTVDKDKIKVKEKEKKNEGNQEETCARVEDTSLGQVVVDPLIIKVQRELNGLTDTHYQALDDYREILTDEVVSHAIDESVANGVRNWAYVEAILRRYVSSNIHSLGEAQSVDEARRQQRDVQAFSKKSVVTTSVNPFKDALERGDFGGSV